MGSGAKREAFASWAAGVGIPPSDNPVPVPSLESYRLCMEACRKGGDPGGALSTLATMRAEGLEPDVVSNIFQSVPKY